MKRVIFGTWIGEFGWELMSWQGYCRKRAEEFDEIVILAPASSEALYADFANRFVPVTPRTGIADCWRREGADLAEMRLIEITAHRLNGAVIVPYGLIPLANQKFIRYGQADPILYFDVVIHARAAIGKRPYHSYSQEKWDKVLELLLRENLSVCAIGTQAFLPQGAIDQRAGSLQHTMNIMASSSVVAGPASGPMLLSLLCKTPIVTWCDKITYPAIKATNRKRFEELWNPFNVQSIIADELGWDAEPERVFGKIMEALKLWRLRP